MSREQVVLPRVFDCERCGTHVGLTGRRQSPWRLIYEENGRTVVHSFCGKACAAAWWTEQRSSKGSDAG
jgi:hypothetical protein